MAEYTIEDKLFTDNPMLDELVHNVKLMLNGIILKDNEEANDNETLESIEESDIFVAIKADKASFYTLKYNKEVLKMLGVFTDAQIEEYALYNDSIPNEYREALFKLASEIFLNNYEEKNNYYRRLNGKPDYKTPGLYLTEEIIPDDYKEYFDFSISIDNYSLNQIALLEKLNVLKELREKYPELKYLNFLGSKSIDIFKARTTPQFGLLWINENVEPLVLARFKELLEINRIIYLKRHYSTAYKFDGGHEKNYYEKIMIIMIISQSVNDLLIEMPEWYIRRDIFDIRTVKYILESNGVKFFKEIPLKYQISLVRNLNQIIKYKSCNKNIYDICDIFGIKDATVYKHYLFKKRNIRDGKYVNIQEETNEELSKEDINELDKMYELLFVRVPIEDLFDNYSRDNINNLRYDQVTITDPYWDGEDDHEYVRQQIMQKDFTSLCTKYLSVESKQSAKEYMLNAEYFLNLILNNKIDKNALEVSIPIINSTSKFKLVDIFILLFVMVFNYYDYKSNDDILNDGNRYVPEIKIPEEVIEKEKEEVYNTDNFGRWESMDGGGVEPEDEAINIDGGFSEMDKEYYQNVQGGRINLSEQDEDFPEQDEDIFNPRTTDLDYNAGKPFGYSTYIDLSGEGVVHNPSLEDYFVADGGYAINSYINPYRYLSRENFAIPDTFFEEPWIGNNKIPHINTMDRICGFNLYADLEWLNETISKVRQRCFNHERGLTIYDLGVEDFKIPENETYKDINEVLDIYKTNIKIYDDFIAKMLEANDQDEFYIYSFVYDYLFTMQLDRSYFKLSNGEIAKTYSEFLKYKDPVLYQYYLDIMSENDPEVRRYNMNEVMDRIAESIETYLGTDEISSVFEFIPVRSRDMIIEYALLLINFFKSYKTYMLEQGATLLLDDRSNSTIFINDKIYSFNIGLEKETYIKPCDEMNVSIDYEKDEKIYIDDRIYIKDIYSETIQIDGSSPEELKNLRFSINGGIISETDPFNREYKDNAFIDLNGGTVNE